MVEVVEDFVVVVVLDFVVEVLEDVWEVVELDVMVEVLVVELEVDEDEDSLEQLLKIMAAINMVTNKMKYIFFIYLLSTINSF